MDDMAINDFIMETVDSILNGDDRTTWHDIQDIVGGYIAKTYGVIDYNKDKDKWREVHQIENDILQKIEKQL